jgi:hypothetical protein
VSQAGQDLLRAWLKRSREAQLSHYSAAESSSIRHLMIGIPAAVFSAVVGTTVFTALESPQSSGALDIRLRILIAFISVVTAILTGCQTFLRFSEKSDEHRSAAAKFGALRRSIEQLLTFPDKITPDAVEQVRKTFDAISEAAPNVSGSIWRRALSKAGQGGYFIPGAQG